MTRLLALLTLLLAPMAGAEQVSSRAKTLVVCDDVQDPATLDPQKEFSEKNHTLVQQIFEGLVRFDADGNIEPALATEWKRLDDRTIQFKLREGVSFHNGEPFDAASVKFSIDRYLNPATGFPAFGFIDSIDHVDVVDDRVVNLVTKYPDGLLLNRLAGFIVMVPPKYYREQPEEVLRTKPVGSGAFMFDRWNAGESIVLRANPSYWKKGYPKVERLMFRFFPLEKQVNALLNGDIDVLTSLPGTKTLDVQKSSQTYVIKKPTFYTVAGNFNVSRRPLSDKNVRQAINLAIDRAALVRYDILGNGLPIATLSLPGETGHDAKLAPYPYDPRKAKALLTEAGYGSGLELNVLLKTNAERTGHIIAQELEQVGVHMNLTLVTDAQLFEQLKQRDRWDVAIYDVPDPMYHAFFIRSIFLSGRSPFSLAAIPAVDARIGALVQTLDPESQRRLSEELDDYVHSEYLALPTYQRIRTYGLRRGVTFIAYTSGMPYFYGTEYQAAEKDR